MKHWKVEKNRKPYKKLLQIIIVKKCKISFQDNKISRENGKNKTSEDEINDLKKQLALLAQQVRAIILWFVRFKTIFCH